MSENGRWTLYNVFIKKLLEKNNADTSGEFVGDEWYIAVCSAHVNTTSNCKSKTNQKRRIIKLL